MISTFAVGANGTSVGLGFPNGVLGKRVKREGERENARVGWACWRVPRDEAKMRKQPKSLDSTPCL